MIVGPILSNSYAFRAEFSSANKRAVLFVFQERHESQALNIDWPLSARAERLKAIRTI